MSTHMPRAAIWPSAHGISELAPTMQLGAGYHRGCQSLRQGRWDQTKSGTRNMLRRVPHCDRRSAWDFARSQFARVVKGVDLRSTAGNCAWARTPQLTQLTTASAPGHTSRCQAVLSEHSLQRQPAPLPVAGPCAAAGHHQLAAGGSRLRHVTLDLTTRRCGPTGGS